MSDDIRARLRNLRGAARPPEHRAQYVPPEQYTPLDQPSELSTPQQRPYTPYGYIPRSYGPPQSLESLVTGEEIETPYGPSYLIRTAHTHDHVHGESTLQGWLSQSLAGAAAFSNDRRLAAVDPRRCLFLDTETTGLSAGAGTLVFLVGVGFWTDDGFEVHQFFLRNPSEELAMLHALRELMDKYEAVVTFNGRSFDMPMIASRYTMNRQHLRVDRWPNLDLLHPARRLWKRRLSSCRLASLEQAILGVERTGDDVPGALIPLLYQQYVQSGDARQMRGVIYHNLIDILSMVTLAATLCDTFSRADAQALPYQDLLSLARWYEQLGMTDQAEAAYKVALHSARHVFDQKFCLEALAAMYKKVERDDEAASLWRAWAELAPNEVTPRLELAKYHEWTTRDLDQAMQWTDAAEEANNARLRNWEQQGIHAEIIKRRARLAQKLSQRQSRKAPSKPQD
jgi:uncharacterized protein